MEALLPYITSLLFAILLGWMAGSFLKPSKAELQALAERMNGFDKQLVSIEKDVANRVTRTELKDLSNSVQTLVREFRLEARAEFKELKEELKTKT